MASIRLPHVYGPQSLLFGLVRQRRVLFPGPGNNPFAQLHVHDAARVLIEAAIQRWSGTGAVADNETVTWNEFSATLTTFAPDVRVLRVSRHLATSAAAVGGALLGRFGPNHGVGRHREGMEPLVVRNVAHAVVGAWHRTSLSERGGGNPGDTRRMRRLPLAAPAV